MNYDSNTLKTLLISLLERNKFPNIQLVCPDESILTSFIKDIVKVYSENYEYLLEINIIDIQSEQSEINNMLSFSTIKTLTNKTDLQKLMIIHQFSEVFSEQMLNAIEECLNQNNLKIIILTTTFHTISPLIKPKIITLNLKPTIRIESNLKLKDTDDFFNLILREEDEKLSEKVQAWSELNCLKLPNDIYEEYNKYLLK